MLLRKNSDFKTKIQGTSKKRKGIKEFVALSITSNDIIADIYDAGKEWNEKEIYSRQQKLCHEVLEIWGTGDAEFEIPEVLNELSSDISKPMERSLESKAAAKKLSVTRKDGTVVDETIAGDTVVMLLKEIVASKGIDALCDFAKNKLPMLDGQPIVQKGA